MFIYLNVIYILSLFNLFKYISWIASYEFFRLLLHKSYTSSIFLIVSLCISIQCYIRLINVSICLFDCLCVCNISFSLHKTLDPWRCSTVDNLKTTVVDKNDIDCRRFPSYRLNDTLNKDIFCIVCTESMISSFHQTQRTNNVWNQT